MRSARATIAAAVSLCALFAGPAGALAIKDSPGGAAVPSAQAVAVAGGAQPGQGSRARVNVSPTLSALSVPDEPTAGPPPRVTLKLEDRASSSVELQVALEGRASPHTSVLAKLGWQATGRALTVAWPKGAKLSAGAYTLLVSGHDRRGAALKGSSHARLELEVVVRAQPAKTTAPAAPSAVPGTPSPSTAPIPPASGVPSPAQSASEGAVFPVEGAHSFGGPENAFGAPRAGYSHQGQDILAAEGTAVLAPYAGEIESTSYQEGGAGYYAVERTAVGFSFFFAHCEAGSLEVAGGESVSAGQQICSAGQSGDATTPHLDFEIWIDGWRTATGYPIDPLPYLEAWESERASA